MVRLLVRGLSRWRPRIGWAAFTLSVSVVLVVAAGLMDADWVQGDVLFLYLMAASGLLSALLAHTRIRGFWAALLLGGVGVLYIGNAVAHFVPPLFDALSELWSGAVWLWWRVRLAEPALLPPAFPAWGESAVRLATFGQRLSAWAVALLNGSSEQNPIAFLFISGVILWSSAAWAVWGLIRWGKPLLAVFPLGLVLSVSSYMSGAHVGYLLGFVACVTLLLPIVHYNWQERRWEREGTDYSTEIGFDVWQVASLLMVAILLLAILTPSISIPRVLDAVWKVISRPQEAIEDFLIRFFGGIEPDPAPPQIPVKPGGPGGGIEASLPRAHLLGGNPGLSNRVVMSVCTDDPPPIPEDIYPYVMNEVPAGPKYYWRGITYETFNGRTWSNGLSRSEQVSAYEPLLTTALTNTRSLRQRYLIYVPHGESLYAASEPYTIDQVVYAKRRMPGDLIVLEGATSDYVAVSQVSQATVEQLMAASIDYPEEIAQRYLQVHRSLPEQVRRLAPEIVGQAATNYEKATAIERYLRQFEYDLEVPSPGSREDVVDYFLFDAQRGYCDYYASSFVVLARLAGVPTRLAVGYATGTYDYDSNCYVVTEMDAHSWPEVYFDGYGWIPWEPTASLSQFERPRDPVSPPSQPFDIMPIPRRQWYRLLRERWREVSGNWTTYVALLGGAALLLLVIRSTYRQVRLLRMRPAERIALYYDGMCELGADLGVPRQPHDTPAEYGLVLARAIDARVPRWPWRAQALSIISSEAKRQVRVVVGAYERASYNSPSLSRAHQVYAERQWSRLERELRWLRQRTETKV